MRQMIEKIWFQPYTPIVVLTVIGFVVYSQIYPSFQRFIKGKQGTPVAAGISPTPEVLGEATILDNLAKLIELPKDEKPQVITITDIERFKDQPFFRNAKNGDVLLVYAKAKKAILYDATNNKIIDIAPIVEGTGSATPTGKVSPTPTKTPTPAPTAPPDSGGQSQQSNPTPIQSGPTDTPVPTAQPTATPTPTESPTPTPTPI